MVSPCSHGRAFRCQASGRGPIKTRERPQHEDGEAFCLLSERSARADFDFQVFQV
jgi:hypothetical protein